MKKRKKQIERFVKIIQLLTSYTSHRNKNIRESIKKSLKILNKNIENNEEDKSYSTIVIMLKQVSKNLIQRNIMFKNNINKLSKLNERRFKNIELKNPIQNNNYFPDNNN